MNPGFTMIGWSMAGPNFQPVLICADFLCLANRAKIVILQNLSNTPS
jgi:hypothetical protein